MLAISDPARAEEWTRAGLKAVAAADDARTKRWETSLHNNYGWTLHDAGDLAGALRSFESALDAAVTDEQRQYATEAIAEVTEELAALRPE
jgi:Tfp pilus assembly protein PilF